jgi:hypothetical protein
MACSSLPFLKSSKDVSRSAASDVIVDNEYGHSDLETNNVDVVDHDVATQSVTAKPMDAAPENEIAEAGHEEANSYSSVSEMAAPQVEQDMAVNSAPVEPQIEEFSHVSAPVKEYKSKAVQKKKQLVTKLPKKEIAKKSKAIASKKGAKGKAVAKADSKKAALACKKVAKNGKKLSKREIATCEKKAQAAKAKYKKVARK